ncbi:hypothetical protein [Hymenobacter terricola]|uniref:hypothetical protein n=1 Tax=Hymenobacter terricola TaxID=2819236 RepID=UPI001B31806F|nr:hypothetical protein [Hymenobacter terricola]
MSHVATLNRRYLVQRMLAWLVVLLLFVLAIGSCMPYSVYQLPTAAPREIRQHHRRAQQARRHRVRQRAYPRPNPEWRQRY